MNARISHVQRRISSPTTWRLIVLLALLLGVGGSNLAAQETPTLTNSLTGLVKLELAGTQQGTLSLSSAPTMGVSVTLLSSDTDVVKLSATGSADDAMDRVTLTFTSSSYTSIPYTIHAAGAGRADIYQMMVMGETTPTFSRLQVVVGTQSKTTGGVVIRSTADDPWHPLYWGGHTPRTFDHIFGESSHFTYQVSLDSAVACPATVEIRATLRGFNTPQRLKRLGILEGTAPPATIPDRADVNQLELDLTFDDCALSKSVTIYGKQDDDTYGVISDLTHTLVQSVGGSETRTVGPVLAFLNNDLEKLNINFIIPKFPDDAELLHTSLEGHNHFYNGVMLGKTFWHNREYAKKYNGWSTTSWFNAYNQTMVLAPRLPANAAVGAEPAWTEFCVYVHGSEIPSKTNAGIPQVKHPYNVGWGRVSNRLYLPELTLVPARHDRQFWWYNPHGPRHKYRPNPDPDTNGLQLPIEIQRYTGDVNGGAQCQVSMMPTHNRVGDWVTVYSGGPPAGDQASITHWRTNVRDTVQPFVIDADDYGKFINIRIRGVHGVNPDAGYEVRRPTGSWTWLKFRALEMLGARMHGSLGIRFGVPGAPDPNKLCRETRDENGQWNIDPDCFG